MKELENAVKKLEIENEKLRNESQNRLSISKASESEAAVSVKYLKIEQPNFEVSSRLVQALAATEKPVSNFESSAKVVDKLMKELDDLSNENKSLREEDRKRRQEMRVFKSDNAVSQFHSHDDPG